MFTTLLAHQWKESRRSSVFQKSVAVNIILGFFIVYFLLSFLVLGFFIDDLLRQVYPDQNPVTAFNGFLLYFFLVDLFMRFMLQDLPVLAIQPYLHLPVKKSRLIHYVLSKSVPSIFNFWSLLILVPFLVKMLVPAYGTGIAAIWLLAVMLLIFLNNFVLIYFKRQLSSNPKLTLAFGIVVLGLMLADYFDLLSLRIASAAAFGFLLAHPWAVLLPALLLAGVYKLNYSFLLAHTYPEEMAVKQNKSAAGTDIAFLNRFGETGKLIALELKLIWRHKRSKSVVFMSLLILAYGFIFYPNKLYQEGFGMLIFVGIMMTGMFMFNYGQFIPSWQSGHFDALLTRRISPYQFYLAKFWFFVPASLAAFLVTLPYAYFGWKVVLINLAAFLFNIGVNVFVVFYFSVLNTSRIDLSKSSAFNWQGVGASKFVMMLPLILLPLLIYAPFGFLGIPYWGIFTIGLLGVAGFALYKQILKRVAKRFLANKYKIATGFRQ
ncbi:MAG: hypothetical protein JWQ14_436 [Adhaeribacter sp.]|nr:hypothetical protein [Adhaeribacter sp.]